MLGKNQMQEIQDLKLRGYTQAEIIDYYNEQGIKPPSRPTIAKYFNSSGRLYLSRYSSNIGK